jgi:hypothetical protein
VPEFPQSHSTPNQIQRILSRLTTYLDAPSRPVARIEPLIQKWQQVECSFMFHLQASKAIPPRREDALPPPGELTTAQETQMVRPSVFGRWISAMR